MLSLANTWQSSDIVGPITQAVQFSVQVETCMNSCNFDLQLKQFEDRISNLPGLCNLVTTGLFGYFMNGDFFTNVNMYNSATTCED